MENELYESITSAGKSSYEALQKLTELNTETMSKLTEVQISMANLGIEGSMGQMKLLTTSGSYDALLAAESDFANEYGEKVMSLATKTSDILTESGEAMSKWFEANMGTMIPAGDSKPTTKKKVAKKVSKKTTAKKKTKKKTS